MSRERGSLEPATFPTVGPQDSVVGAVYARLEQLLPLNSGLNVKQFQMDRHYIHSRNTLISLAETDIFRDAVICTIQSLEHIDAKSKHEPLRKRSEKSLWSTFLILRLFSDVADKRWNSVQKGPAALLEDRDSTLSDHLGSLEERVTDMKRERYHSVRPPPLDPIIVKKALVVVTNLKSKGIVMSAVRTITGQKKKSVSRTEAELIIEDIEACCNNVIQYFCGSNPSEYRQFVLGKLRTLSSTVPDDYVPHMDLIEVSFVDEDYMEVYVGNCTKLYATTKRPLDQQLILFFMCRSLRRWILADPDEYLRVTAKHSVVAEQFFDIVYKTADLKTYRKSTYEFFAVMTLLNPKSYLLYNPEQYKGMSFIASSSKRSSAQSALPSPDYKALFVNELATMCQKHPEAGASLTKTLVVGSTIWQLAPDHPLTLFTLKTAQKTYDDLRIEEPDMYPAGIDQELYDNLRMDCLCCLANLESPMMAEKALRCLAEEKPNYGLLRIYCGSLHAMLDNRSAVVSLYRYIKESAPPYRDLMITIAKKLRQNAATDDDTASVESQEVSSSVMDLKEALGQQVVPSVTNQSAPSINSSGMESKRSGLSSGGGASHRQHADTLSSATRQQTANSQQQSEMSNASSSGSSSGPSGSGAATASGTSGSEHQSSGFKSLYKSKMLSKSFFRGSHSNNNTSPLSPATHSFSPKSPTGGHKSATLTPVSPQHVSHTSSSSASSERAVVASSSSIVDPLKFVKRPLDEKTKMKGILIDVLSVFEKLPHLFLINPDAPFFHEDGSHNELSIGWLQESMKAIAFLLLSDDESATPYIVRFFMSFVKQKWGGPSMYDDPKAGMEQFSACFLIVSSLTDLLCTEGLPAIKRDQILDFGVKFLDQRKEVFTRDSPRLSLLKTHGMHKVGGCRFYLMGWEKAFVLLLFHDNAECYKMARKGLEYLIEEAALPWHCGKCSEGLNVELYKAMISDRISASGAATRKKLRDHLSKTVYPNTSMIYIWGVMYDRWMNSPIGPKHGRDPYGSDYPGFMASWGGAFLAPDLADHPEREELVSKYEYFLRFQIDSLKLDDWRLREKAREVLSVALHPFAVQIVSNSIKTHVDQLPDALSDRDFIFFDQLISVLKHVLSLDTKHVYPHVNLIMQILKGMMRLLDSQEESVVVLKSKIKFLFLAGIFFEKAEDLGFAGDVAGRNRGARVLVDWLEHALFRDENDAASTDSPTSFVFDPKPTNAAKKPEPKPKPTDLDHLCFDFAVETARVLAIGLKGLVLDVPHANFQPEDLVTSLEVAFRNYSNLFVRILEKVNDSTQNADESPAVKHRGATLVNHIVSALIDLLKANVKIGLKFVLPLCYHGQSHHLRYSFINVLASIMDHDNLDIYGQLNERVINSVKKGYEIFLSVPPLYVTVAQACPMGEVDTLAAALLSVSDDEEFVLQVMSNLIKVDIMQTTESVQILRSNTVATRMIALYSNSTAGRYLVSVLYPVLQDIIENGKDFEVEKRNVDDESAQLDVQKFMESITHLVDAICNSADTMPVGLKKICAAVYEATNEVFPDSKIVAVGAFVFLRLFGPAIVVPERADVSARVVQPAVKRSMIQMARVVQLMANDSLSSLKWPLLREKMDDLFKLQRKIEAFLLEVSQVSLVLPEGQKFEPAAQMGSSNGYLHRFFYDHYKEIRNNFFNPVFSDSLEMGQKIKTWSEMDQILNKIGLPQMQKSFTIPDAIRDDTSPQGVHLYDFMSKFSANEAELPQDQSFMSETLTRDGTPVIIMVYEKIPENMDVQVVCYRIFQYLCKVWESKFYLFVDCTRYRSHHIHSKLMDFVTSYYPEKYKYNLEKYIFFNVSQDYSASLRQYMNTAGKKGFFVQTEYYFLNSLDDIKVFTQLGLPQYITPASTDSKVTFTDVKYWQESVGRFVPVTLKIGTQYLQVLFNTKSTIKTRKAMKSFQMLDIHKIEDIVSVDITTTTGVSNEMTVIDEKFPTPLIFCSPRRIEIMRTIYFSKSKRSPTVDFHSRDESTSDFYAGALLNIAFLGLISHHDDIRGSSFKLLYSVGKTFGMDFGRHVEAVSDLSFPARNDGYVYTVSQALAMDKPNLTCEFLNSFFIALEHSAIESKPSVIYYASPWLKNIYKNVYRAHDEFGVERTAHLIKQFVATSRKYESVKVPFSQYIWAQLSLEDNLVDIIIDETIAAAIDLEAEGYEWEEIVSLWPLASTIEIFGNLVNRIHEKSRMKILKANSIVESHTNWMEITILVKLMAFLMFDSLIFAETYLGDIFYIISVFLDVGPLELRVTLHRLTVKTMHAILSKPDLSPEAHMRIVSEVSTLNGARFRMLFGLNREDSSNMSVNVGGEMVTKAAAMESFCDLIFTLPDLITNSNVRALWRVRWNAQTVRTAFLDNSMLQGRALLVLGNLAKRGIDDLSAIQFLKYLSRVLRVIVEGRDHDDHVYSLSICALHSFAKVVNGISSSSPFITHFFWFGYALSLYDNIVYYQLALRIMSAALKKLIEADPSTDGDIVTYLVNQRSMFDHHLREYEGIYGFGVEHGTFDYVMLAVIVKGVQIPFTTDASMEFAKYVFRLRYRCALKAAKAKGEPLNMSCFGYMIFPFLLEGSNDEVTFLVKDSVIKDEHSEMVSLAENILCPQPLLKLLRNGGDTAALVLYTATVCFNSSRADEVLTNKYVHLIKDVSEHSISTLWLVYPFAVSTCRSIVESASSMTAFVATLNVINKLVRSPEYKFLSQYQTRFEKLLNDKHVSGFKTIEFTNANAYDAKAHASNHEQCARGRYVKLILDRIISAYIEVA